VLYSTRLNTELFTLIPNKLCGGNLTKNHSYKERSMKELFKNVIGCFQLHKDVEPRDMQANVYSALICFRKTTSEISLNPMDYIFSVKPLASLATTNGFYFYMKIHNSSIANDTSRLFKEAIDVTYQVSQAVPSNEEAVINRIKHRVLDLHNDIDRFILGMPPDIKASVDRLAKQLIESASLTSRMRDVLLIQES
jgi:hypothetical protein|tara:strand:+ start:2973 stop:3557 length:585 start_codon:yes stop_codon:yes gene_type:complete